MAREYKPNSYEKHKSQGPVTSMPTGSTQLDHDAIIAACLNSERSASTVDLADRKCTERFAHAASSFHPQLVALLNEWAGSKSPEQTRDQLRIGGKSASELMWEQGKTFVDIVCDAQRSFDGDLRKLPDISVASVHEASPTPIKPHSPARPKLNPLQRFANFVSRGAYESRRIAKTEAERRDTLEVLPENPSQNIQHNKDILSAEQIVKDGMQEQQAVQKAADILNERQQEILRMQEKRTAYIESFLSREKETQELISNLIGGDEDSESSYEDEDNEYNFEFVSERPTESKEVWLSQQLARLSGQVANRQGATITVDLSTQAMAVAEVERSCIHEILVDLGKDSTAMKDSVQRGEKQLEQLRNAAPAQCGRMGKLSAENLTVGQCSDNTQLLVQATRQTNLPATESYITIENYSELAYFADRVGRLRAPMQQHPDQTALAQAQQKARSRMMDDIVQDAGVRASQMSRTEPPKERERVKIKELTDVREHVPTATKAAERGVEKAPKAL